jgi:DNA-binding transcriptional LysR family regulator
MNQTELLSRRLKLQHLNVAMAVAQSGSMGKAAKQLAVSQPVVSKAISDLEGMLGVRLFDRDRHGVEPTLYGRALLKRSLAIFDDLKTSVDEIKFLADCTTGELRIGSTEPQLGRLVAAVMERLLQRYPRISIRIVQSDGATLMNRELPQRRVELAVTPLLTPSLPEGLQAAALFQDRLVVVGGLKSRWLRQRKVRLAELADEPWCVPPLESSVGILFANAFRNAGLDPPRITVAISSIQFGCRMLENPRFLSIFSESIMHFYGKRLSVKPLSVKLGAEPYPVAIVTVKNRLY